MRLLQLSAFLVLTFLMALPIVKNSAEADQKLTPFLKEALAERIIGSEEAKLTVVEFFSFTCPACGRFHTEVYP